MPDGPSLVPPRRRLRAEIRALRQRAELTQEQVAQEMDWSLSKVIRIEAGSVGISTNDLKALLRLYKIADQARVSELVALARLARERSWWDEYKDILATQYIQFIAFEAAASSYRGFQPTLIPGLLQTEEYARITLTELGNGAGGERIDRLVKVRMKRQEVLDRADHPALHFIIDEAVIRRMVGGKDLMRRQISHIADVTDKRNVTVQVLPFDVGVHPGMQGPFVIFEFADAADDDVLYLEGPRGDMIIRDVPEDVAFYSERFEKLRHLSLNPAESVHMLKDLANSTE